MTPGNESARMRHIWFPLVLLVVSAIARADDPKTLDDYKKLVTPAMRKTLDEQFTFLNRWPDASAQKAVEQIVSIGHAAIPDLIEELNGGHWRAQVASAYICGQLRRPITYEAVANSARQPKVQPHLGIYFKALARIDRSRAIKTLSGFIESRFPDVRQLALRYSVGLVKQSDLPMIVKLAEHPRVATRVVAMTLLGLAGGWQSDGR